jgi:FixJ family two-component response regulator
MATCKVIVVTPDVAFRRSLVFVLESSGFRVLAYGSLDAALTLTQDHCVGCAVVDEDSIRDWQHAQPLFESFAHPIILLVDHLHASPNGSFVRRLAKPFLGEPLLHAVQEAIAGKSDPDT